MMAVISGAWTIVAFVLIAWGWAAYISERRARRTGRTRAVRYPDEVLWDIWCRLIGAVLRRTTRAAARKLGHYR